MISSSSISISRPSLSLPLMRAAGMSKFHPDPPKTICMVSSTSCFNPCHEVSANDFAENDLRRNTDAPPRIGFTAVADDGYPDRPLMADWSLS